VRNRSTDADRTVRRRVDVARAFRDAELDDLELDIVFAEDVAAPPEVHALVPLDAIPVLAVPAARIAWYVLDELSTTLLLRVDGVARTMSIVTGTKTTPSEGARALGRLAGAGIVRLVLAAD
jgi:hypothetical protein